MMGVAFGSSQNWFQKQTFNDIYQSNLVLDLDAGLSASYPGSGSTWFDMSNFNNDVTLVNNPTYSLNTLTFNGIDQYGYAPAGFADFTGGFTFICIANMGNTSYYERLIDFGNGTDTNNLLVCRNSTSDQLELYVSGAGANFSDTGFIVNNATKFYAIVHNNTTTKYYKNGTLITTASAAWTIPNITRNNCYIAESNWPSDPPFEGTIGLMKIYNCSMSDADIQTRFDYFKGRFGL